MGKGQTNREVLARIKQKVEDPLKNLSEQYQKELLEDTTAAFLKDLCKTRGIRGYSGKNKLFISGLIVANLPKDELGELLNILSKTVKRIKYYKNYWQERFLKDANIITRSDEILQSEPDNISAMESKIYALKSFGEVEEVLRIYNMILKIDPNYSYIMSKKAELLAEQKEFEEALYWYEKALEISSSEGIQGDLIAKIGKILDIMGRIDEAEELIKKALEGDRTGVARLNFDYDDIEKLYRFLIGLQIKNKEDDDAVLITFTNWGNHLLDVYNYLSPEIFLRKANLLEYKGDYEEAQKALDEIIEGIQGEVWTERLFDTTNNFMNSRERWREVFFHKARICALQDDRVNLMKNLNRAITISLDMGNWYGYRTINQFLDELKEDIRLTSEFDGYREDQDFFYIVNPAEKITNFYKEKNLTPEKLSETQKELIAYLCKHVGVDIYLDFKLFFNTLQHNSDALSIVLNNSRNEFSLMKIKYPYEESLGELKMTKEVILKSDSCKIDGTVYNKEFFDIALKIMDYENEAQDQVLVSTKLNYPLRLRSGNKYAIFIAPIVP